MKLQKIQILFQLLFIAIIFISCGGGSGSGGGGTPPPTNCFKYLNNSVEVEAGGNFTNYGFGEFVGIATGNYRATVSRKGDFETQNLQVLVEAKDLLGQVVNVKSGDIMQITGYTNPDMSGKEELTIKILDITNRLICELKYTVKIK